MVIIDGNLKVSSCRLQVTCCFVKPRYAGAVSSMQEGTAILSLSGAIRGVTSEAMTTFPKELKEVWSEESCQAVPITIHFVCLSHNMQGPAAAPIIVSATRHFENRIHIE
jgi:hypothetical protein